MISFLLILAASLFFMGVIARIKSIAQGRKGPGIFQPLRDMRRLLRKGAVFSETTSWIFQFAPSLSFAALVTAALTVPFADHPGLLSFRGDFVFFAYMLALGKFFMIMAAMDTGSPFEGMGAAREGLYSLLVEPAFFILIGSFGLLTGNTSFFDIFSKFHFNNEVSYLMGGMAAYVLFQIAMIENSRLPVDDPKTHLELTMVHEVMILDTSGPDLAMMQMGVAFKFAVYGALIANFILPPALPIWLEAILFLLVQFLFSVMVGLAESFRARKRMRLNVEFIFTLTSLSILLFFTALVLTQKL